MAEGRCLRCREQVEIENPIESKTTRGLRIIKGTCPKCNTKVCRILGK
jgi:hypothetical protein